MLHMHLIMLASLLSSVTTTSSLTSPVSLPYSITLHSLLPLRTELYWLKQEPSGPTPSTPDPCYNTVNCTLSVPIFHNFKIINHLILSLDNALLSLPLKSFTTKNCKTGRGWNQAQRNLPIYS